MNDSPQEVHEIVGREFARCGGYLSAGGHCSSVRRFAVRLKHIGLYCGLGPDAHNFAWLPNLPWAKPADFVDPGPFAGWVAEGAFQAPRREPKVKRRGGWSLSDAVYHEFAARVCRRDAKCMVCEATWYRGERNTREALIWLRTFERFHLYDEVHDAIRKMMPKPTVLDPTWYDRLPGDLRLDVKNRFDDSRLRPDQALSIAFLRAARRREGRRFIAAVQRFGVDGLALPSCDKCKGVKGALLFETRDELLTRWAEYRFSGNVPAARSHPDYVHFEYLSRLAYQTDIVGGLAPVCRQRERRA